MNRHRYFPYLLLLPSVVLFALFTVYPIIASLVLSFQRMEGGIYQFVGLANYERLLQDQIFLKALQNTLLILVFQVPIMLLLALILATVLNNQLLKFKGLFRVGFYLPAVTSLVAYALLFSIILQDTGLINNLLGMIGIDAIPWLSSPFWAKVSLIMAMTWRWTGYNMVIYLAALQNIPEETYEAAQIDGAGKIRQFFSMTIPQLQPIILFTAILSTIGTLQLFDEPYNLTKGGPADATMTLGLYIYNTGFSYFDFGYASAISYVVVIIVALLSLIQFKWAGEKNG